MARELFRNGAILLLESVPMAPQVLLSGTLTGKPEERASNQEKSYDELGEVSETSGPALIAGINPPWEVFPSLGRPPRFDRVASFVRC